MQIGMVGLGRMGLNMARRLAGRGHQVVAYNRSYEKAEAFAAEYGGLAAESLAELAAALETPRRIWVMLPEAAVEGVLYELMALLEPGDILVEGGNSYYKNDLKREPSFRNQGITYMDAGVSGGIWGLENGYCVMLGGPEEGYEALRPLLDGLCAENGHLHTGPVGSGHYVKMIHNAIEYGMMQAYAEGFDLMRRGPFAREHDFEKISRLWLNGSVVRSWLLELLERAFAEDPGLEELKGYVDDSGEGRWAVQEALDTASFAPVIALSLMDRFRSRQSDTFGDKVLAALRNQFGGHAVKKS